MHRLRAMRLAAVLGVLSVVLGACGASSANKGAEQAPGAGSSASGSPTTSGSQSSSGSLSWHVCSAGEGPAGYQCATLRVPIDPAHPGASTINLALDRHPATGTSSGSLVVNPGGPGVSAVDSLPQIVAMLGADVKTRFDIVAFDPPGVGHSDPVDCFDNAALGQYLHVDPAPPGPAGLNEVLTADRQLASACEAHSGAVLGHVSTADAARDMDLVRKALGGGKLNFLGFSYGTSLGAAYAQLFGADIRSMVLDGAIDPSQGVISFLQAQAASIETEFTSFAGACQTSVSCPWHNGGGGGGSLVSAFQSLLTRVRQHPIPVGDRTVGPSELIYGTVAGLYSTQSWPVIYQALADAEAGDGTLILSAFDQYVERSANGTYANTFEAESAVNCLDDPAPSVSTIAAAEPAFTAAAPIFGTTVLYGELSCSVWPVPATSGPHLIAAPQAPAIVVVGSTGDPVTPYPGAQHLAAQLTNGVLLTRSGDGHTGYGASSCIRADVDAYLIALTVPAKGTICPSDGGG